MKELLQTALVMSEMEAVYCNSIMFMAMTKLTKAAHPVDMLVVLTALILVAAHSSLQEQWFLAGDKTSDAMVFSLSRCSSFLLW